MRTQDPSQIRDCAEHLHAVSTLGDEVTDALKALARQLLNKDVLPLIGAGGSVDCGMCLAGVLGEELKTVYLNDRRFGSPRLDIEADLGVVAQEIYLASSGSQEAVVEAMGLGDAVLWPAAAEVTPHFCAYSVLARLTRERAFESAISLNYDCGYEAALHGEGFFLAPDVRPGQAFSDHVTVAADAVSAVNDGDKGSFHLRKIHGCAQRYRSEKLRDPTSKPEEAIIVRKDQLQNWQGRDWALRALQLAAQEKVLVLLGFSANDANIVGELTQRLDEVFALSPPTGEPRVVVINHSPSTQELRNLAFRGRGKAALGPGMVDQVDTSGGTTTAALLVLLGEMLAMLLDAPFAAAGYALPDELEARLVTLVLSAPYMLRWSFLLRQAEPGEYIQGINLHDAAERGYVPLTHAAPTAARALRRRAELRASLGLGPVERAEDLIAAHGFVVDPKSGTAYLPTGLDDDKLEGACRPGGPLWEAQRVLPAPRMTCIIVGDGAGGFNLSNGRAVTVS